MTITVGDTYTTAKSKYTGTVTDIIERNGRWVLELDGERYTTI